MLSESQKREDETYDEVDYVGKTNIINENLKKSIEKLQKLSEEFEKRYDEEELIDENTAFDE